MGLILLMRRRGFLPSSLSGLKLWLDATRITGLVDGDPVATWSDLSGLGNHATQGTGSKKPTYKTGIQNGKAIVRFDGVDDALTTPTMPATTAMTVFVVYCHQNAGNNGYVIDFTAIGHNSIVSGFAATVEVYDTPRLSLGAWGVGAFHVHTFVRDVAPSTTGYRDGTQAATTGSVQAAASATYRIGDSGGASDAVQGDIGEMLIYHATLTTAQRQQVEAYLRGRWGTP